jgi:cyclopropane-fatty-acyl-phospholipid synthase
MGLLDFENSRIAYRADFAFYGLAVAGLAVALVTRAPRAAWLLPALVALVAGGYLLWSLLEYGLHRFVLHGVQPFRRLHEQHHLRPLARMGTPTVVSAPLFATLVLLPAWLLLGRWPACALTLGVLGGYLHYAVIHHLCHHRRGRGAWLLRRQRWHARHHSRIEPAGCYGVSHSAWDRVFGTASNPARPLAGAGHQPG